MKKNLLILAAGLMALTACTNDEIIDLSSTQSNAIGFRNVVGNSTREGVSGDLDNTTFDQFFVYGYYTKPSMSTPIQIFNGVRVYKTDDTANPGKKKWTYNDVRYWVPGCTYYFYAYSCADIALTTGNGSPAFSLFDATNPSVDEKALTISKYVCDSSHQHDLVTAENERVTASTEGATNADVALSFSHALCKVKAVFTTDFPADYQIYISNVYLSNFHNKADFNVGTGTWSGHIGNDATPSPSVTLAVPSNSFVINSTGSNLTTSEAFLIPKAYDNSTSENVKIHFTITVKKGDAIILERPVVGTWSPQWERGKIYQYSINISGSTAGIQPIVFAAEQDLSGNQSWGDSTEVNMVFGVDTNENAGGGDNPGGEDNTENTGE